MRIGWSWIFWWHGSATTHSGTSPVTAFGNGFSSAFN